uniref:Ecto-NOX disulfide-thiol exchanger 1/2 domain-containing protein n=1 Tax=Graphocephala atropunctata TaxID=36148 RepID=A0A1B6LXZ8_9HEMI
MTFNYPGNPPLPLRQGQMMGGPMMMGPMIGPQGFPQGMMGPIMNPEQMGNSPGMNDAPLEFNTNKNKPPMPLTGEELEREQRKVLTERERERNGRDTDRDSRRDRERNRDRGRDRRDRDRDRDRREERDSSNGNSREKSPMGGSSPVQQPQSEMAAPTPTPQAQAASMWGGMMGPMGYPVMGMNPMMGAQMMDPSMMMGQYNMMGMQMPEGPMMGPDGTIMPPDPSMVSKEIIHFKTFTLFPPSPSAPPPTTRERPPGCKTIFVGGLPENATGYRMRIGSNTDIPNTGRLHVDYAQARDDQYEWECRQRQLQREQRHRDRMEKERLRVPSPPPVVHYSDHEANLIADKIKTDEQFTKAVQVVITWLERGDCNKRNSNAFYSMIQSTNSHVRRLLTEKATYEEELTLAKELMKGRMQGLLIQFSQIERVFSAASHKKVWDHFTKPQRKNIEMWKKQATEIKTVELEENLLAGGDEEMEVSDTDDDYPMARKKPRKDDPTAALKEENDSLRCQLEAYKNEVDLVKVDLKLELEQKDKQLKMCQQTLQGMQQQLLDAKRKQGEEELRVLELQARLKAKQTKEKQTKEKETKEGEEVKDKEETEGEVDTTDSLLLLSSKLSEKEAKLVGLISIFLHVHPFGAGVDYIWSYLQKLDPTLRTSEVETVMARFPSMFLQELSGIGANMERRWVYAGYKNTKPEL